MPTSNKLLQAILLGACGLAFPLHADEVTLAGESSRLTGSVRSINQAGIVELASPLAREPLLLKGDKVDKVEFSNTGPAPEPPPALIELANGDILPAAFVSMDERILTVNSPEAGRLEIPREALASAQLGISHNKVIYSGPRSIEEWSNGDPDTRNWSFRNRALVAKGPASASRKIDLPHQFILRFTLKWEATRSPNYKIYFADPLLPKGEPCDRYYLQFNSAGLEIKREASKGRHYNPLVTLNRTPNQYPDHQIEVEVRVDRNSSPTLLELYINGEKESKTADPISPVPNGSGITLASNASSGTDQEIHAIEVLEYDDARVRHRAEDRGDPKTDSLISRDEERRSGRLIDIRGTDEGTMFRFKSDFQDEPLEIPETEVSTVFFASGDASKTEVGGKTPFVLHLRGNGSLQVSSCEFSDAGVSADHPLLGPLELRREGILSIERNTDPKKPEPAPEP